ncbi:hypothetical protein [Embleya scabrispora]|uniref:hypothetical protein n=1 Tax=Embleya scabrispora TaxID=159449 RepID=UPI0003A9A372|nr:hypothetical protein [Embleya scabrispora]MYS79128.1 HEAT repeat domain-containing protein [Streptomyces sp. SID5474]
MDDSVDAKALYEAWSESLRQAWSAAERVHEHWSERWEGTDRDVRVVVARMPVEVRDGFVYDQVPWNRFAHTHGSGVNVPDYLNRTRSADPAAAQGALGALWSSICHQGTRCSVAPLAVPFLLRIAADPSTHPRADALTLVATVARRNCWEDGSRADLLKVADSLEDDPWHFDMGGYFQNWTVEAARDAIAADAHIPIALLDDPDPEIREAAAYVLAALTSRAGEISTALHDRFLAEDHGRVRASLLLAIAQLAREHRHEDAAAFTHALWSDPARRAEDRVCAALGWLCLVDDPVPDAVRAVLDECVTVELGRAMGSVPWMRQVDHDGDGLDRTLARMFDPDSCRRPASADDPWAEAEGCADDPPF